MNALAHITRFTLAGLVAVLVLPTAARAVPDSKGLVLWLDAADEATVTRDAAGRVSRWADKSPAANHAVQNDANMRPEYAPEGIGPRPALHFDGGALLNLGRPGSLAFRPKMPFTMAVVYRAERGDSGTFIAKGGGSAGQRAYQFYVTPNKLGAISYGAMREGPVERGADLAILVCDGSKSRAYARGGPVFSQTAGRAVSNCDVLVGARRKEPYNSGAYYMLRGRIAELVVYNRALGPKELNELGGYFNKKYQLEVGSLAVDSVEGLAAALDSPHAAARVDGLAESVMRFGDAAREPLESLLAKRPESAPMVADILLRAARKNQLADGPAEVAARLLSHDDPFVRGMAEWSLGMKLGLENNGQVARYQDGERKKGSGPFCPQGPSGASHKRVLTPFCSPGQKGPDPILPEWYKQYTALSQQAMVEADWARQAVSHNLHHDSGKLAASVDRMIERAELMLADFRRDGADKGTISLVERELAAIGAVRDKLTAGATAGLSSSAKQKPHTSTAGQPGSGTRRNRLWIQARRHMRRIALANPAVDFERGGLCQTVLAAYGAEHHPVLRLEAQAGWRYLHPLRPGRGCQGRGRDTRPAGAGLRLGAGPLVGRRSGRLRLRPADELAAGGRHDQLRRRGHQRLQAAQSARTAARIRGRTRRLDHQATHRRSLLERFRTHLLRRRPDRVLLRPLRSGGRVRQHYLRPHQSEPLHHGGRRLERPAPDRQQGHRPLPAQPRRRPHRLHALGVPGAPLHGGARHLGRAARRHHVRHALQAPHAGAPAACATPAPCPAARSWSRSPPAITLSLTGRWWWSTRARA